MNNDTEATMQYLSDLASRVSPNVVPVCSTFGNALPVFGYAIARNDSTTVPVYLDLSAMSSTDVLDQMITSLVNETGVLRSAILLRVLRSYVDPA